MDPKLDFESLKGDVSIIQSCTAELLSVGGTLNVPSWRFPEMTSNQVNANKVLEKISYSEDKEKFTVARTLLLELTVDRLMFLLQCAFRVADSVDEQSSSVPLSLGSVAKRLTKQTIRDCRKVASLKQQLDKKTDVIVKFQNKIKALEKDNVTLRDMLSKATSASEEGKEDMCVISPVEDIPLEEDKPNVKEAAVQTTETAFALCATCVSMQKCLLMCSAQTSQVCKCLSITPQVASQDFNAQMEEKGRFDHVIWLSLLQQDMSTVKDAVSILQEQCRKLNSELAHKEQEVENVSSELVKVDMEFDTCKANFQAEKQRNELNMADLVSKYETKVDQLRQHNSKLINDIDNIEVAMSEYRRKEAIIKVEMSKAKQNKAELGEELERAAAEVVEQKKRCTDLQQVIRAMTDELQTVKDEIQDKIVALKKSEAQNKTLSKRDKVTQSKQLALQNKLEQLGKECTSLRTELNTAILGKEETSSTLSEVEEKCHNLHDKLAKEEEKALLAETSLQSTIRSLEGVKVELEKEKEKCLLLMDYPSLSISDPNYFDCLKSLSYFDSKNHLSANIIRIMLLEDQNKDLRKIALQDAQEGEPTFELTEPVQLWNGDLLKTVKQQYKINKKKKQNYFKKIANTEDDIVITDIEKTSPPGVHEHSFSSGSHPGSPNTRTKGSIGRLMTALNDSKLIAPPNSFVKLHDNN